MERTTKQELIELSKKLISLESTERNIPAQRECLDLLVETFGKDMTVQRYEFRGHPALVLATSERKTFDVIFSGHVDVVHGDKDLFKPVVREGRLFGRGAYDMKAGLVACLCAARDHKKNGGTKEVGVLVTSDEETSGYGTQTLLNTEGFGADFAFIADGGDEKSIVLKQKGFLQVKVTAPGKSAHASETWKGDDPFVKIFRAYQAVVKEFPGPNANDQWQTSVALTRISSNNSLNQIPERADGYFDIRFVTNADPDRITKILLKAAGKGSVIETVAENAMFLSDGSNPYTRTLVSVLRERSKKKVSFMNENGTSDAVFFTEHGIPAALFRPKGGAAHQQGEWVDTDSLYLMYEVLGDLLERAPREN